MKKFIGANRDQRQLLPYDLEDWLPENHLARFIVEIVSKLNFKHIYQGYKGVGSTPYDPKLLLGLLFYGYATGVFSSRKIEQATYDSVAFRYISGNHHPDHDTIANFRKSYLAEIRNWFKEILLIGKELGLLRIGNIYIDGTKIQANASRHKAMSYDYMQRLEKQLETEIEKLLERADRQDEKEKDLDLDLPKEIERREQRLAKIQEAKKVVEKRVQERYLKAKQEYDEKMKCRRDKQDQSGRKPRGKVPAPPSAKPNASDQYNFTDPQSRIMKTSHGFDQCYNSQAVVNDDMIIVGAYSNAHANDKQEFLPCIESVPQELSDQIETAVADTGYFSEENVKQCHNKEITPLISTCREKHNTFLNGLLSGEEFSPPTSQDLSPLQQMQCYLKSKGGKATYSKRKQKVEPAFGVIKEILGFRRFSLRGETETDGEWGLVCTAYNLKRLFNMQTAFNLA